MIGDDHSAMVYYLGIRTPPPVPTDNGYVHKFDANCRFPLPTEDDKIEVTAFYLEGGRLTPNTRCKENSIIIMSLCAMCVRVYVRVYVRKKNTRSDERNDVIASLVRINIQKAHARFRIEFHKSKQCKRGKNDFTSKSRIDWVRQPTASTFGASLTSAVPAESMDCRALKTMSRDFVEQFILYYEVVSVYSWISDREYALRN